MNHGRWGLPQLRGEVKRPLRVRSYKRCATESGPHRPGREHCHPSSVGAQQPPGKGLNFIRSEQTCFKDSRFRNANLQHFERKWDLQDSLHSLE